MVSRVSLGQVNALPDLLPSDGFLFILGNIPGGDNDKNMCIKATNATLPGIHTENFEVRLFGHTITHRGQKNTNHILNVGYLEDSTFDSVSNLYNWMNFVADTTTGNSTADKSLYASDSASLFVYDQMGNISASYRFLGLYPKDIADVELTGESTQLLRITVQFSYDYYIPGFSNGLIQDLLGSFGINIDVFNSINQTIGAVGGNITNLSNSRNSVSQSLSQLNSFLSSGTSPF